LSSSAVQSVVAHSAGDEAPLVSTAELAAHLLDPLWVVVDCRHDPFDFAAGALRYQEGHIPGARFASVAQDLSAPTAAGRGRHPLPDVELFTARLAQWGITPRSRVVAYDASGNSYAARFWWLCRWLGLSRVAVLDGGWDKWIAEGRAVSSELPDPAVAAALPQLQPNDSMWVDVAFVEGALAQDDLLLIDARLPERYRGDDEPQDRLAGHIPGAINRYYKANLDPHGCFLPAEELRRQFAALIGPLPMERVIQQCGAGINACNNLLAMELAGLQGSRLYPGSWSEWCAVDRPIAVGEES